MLTNDEASEATGWVVRTFSFPSSKLVGKVKASASWGGGGPKSVILRTGQGLLPKVRRVQGQGAGAAVRARANTLTMAAQRG